MLDVPIFRKSVRTGYGYEISPHEPLIYPTLLSLMKVIGLILGLLQPTRLYCLRYNAANEFNQSGDVTDALQNMMLQHASVDTFIKHYLPRRSGDIRAIVSGYEPQKDLMRAASRITRWIDPGRPHALTLRDKWDTEHPVNDVELQLAGLKFCDDPSTSVHIVDEMPPIQKRLAETVITLPGTTVVEEFRRRNAAIDAVAAFCHFQEGGAVAMPHGRPSTQKLAAAEAEKKALRDAMLLVFTEKRTTTCFLCLGEQSLPFEKRTYKFASPGDLTKHFKRKHLAHIKEGDRLQCKVCRMGLQHKQHLQNHAESIHGTVS
ncbi:hypothetical protein BKA65DRAFT_471486 [Rhexocercosporidium sp. MPI-PUGE-AT-0058]|nr:hypothetical protein BKA65DRAFT_471486 [Rhexocercosporidium sp. MPI-PUGE-AT-0058]